MALEIEGEFRCTPHRVTQARALWDHQALTNNHFMPHGWRLRDGEHSRINIYLPRVPTGIHLTTPNAIVRVRWFTPSASANAMKLYLELSDVEPDVDTYDPSSFDFALGQTDTSPGAGVCSERTWTLSGLNLAPGRELIGFIRRDRQTPDAADSLAADVIITNVFFQADKAA